MSEVDLGKVMMTEIELGEFILQFNGGLKIGKMDDGSPGYYKNDEETGEETLVPFSLGGGGLEGGYDVLKTEISPDDSRIYLITLTRDYKAILSCSYSYYTNSTASSEIILQNETFYKMENIVSGTGRVHLRIGADLTEHKANEVYTAQRKLATGTLYGTIWGIY